IEPADVAACVLWLSGHHAAHVTGTSIPLDGGWTAA
ncbi:MAG: 3-hydroxybutyrate dehydrogenase, partial [Pseudonocardiaceae bacterium]